MIKIKLHEEDCEYCSMCEKKLPDIFKLGEFSAELRKKKVSDKLFERLKDIIKNCPGDAVELL